MFCVDGALTGREVVMSFAISALKTCFTLLNLLSMMFSATILGFGVFMLISRQDAIGLGLHEVSVALLATGAGIAVCTMIGFCSGVGRRSYMMHFYSGCLLLGSVYMLGFGIITTFRRSKTEEYMDESWNEMTNLLKDAFETVHNCCGFNSVGDRSNCSELKQSTSRACSGLMIARQEELLKWLCVCLFSVSVVGFLNYLVSYSLTRQYSKSRRQFQQANLDFSKERSQPGQTKDSRKTDTTKAKQEQPLKTSKLGHGSSAGMKYLPDFLKPVPKPKITSESTLPRSTGSMLTYEQIAAKYRRDNSE